MRTDILGHPPSLCNCRRVWHPCHTHAPYQGVQWSPLHQPSKNCTNQAATASSHSKRLLCILRVPWDNTTQPKHLCHPWENTITAGGVGMAGMPYPPKCILWENTHCLLVYSFLVYLKINDYGYAPGWRSQPKPIVLARHPSSRRGRPASLP